MTFHIFSAVAAMLVCTAAGFYKSTFLTRRVRYLDHCLAMLQKMEVCLEQQQMSTPDLLALLAQNSSLSELAFLSNCHRGMLEGEVFPVAWERAVQEEHTGYLDDDLTALGMIGGILGSSDAYSQIKELKVVAGLLKQCRQDALSQSQEKGKMYRSLGVLSGIGLAIMLI